MTTNFEYPKGSEWRKWDLHVHSPLSALNNGYPKQSDDCPDWEAFVGRLEKIKELSVLGITDYFSIAGYKQLLEFRKKGRLKDLDLILPNIELRLDTFVVNNKSKDINFHIIFSEKVAPEDIEKEFIGALDIQVNGSTSGLSGNRKLNERTLVELGKKIKRDHAHFKADTDLAAALKNVTVSLTEVQKLLSKDLFKDKFLLVLAGGEWCDIDWNQAYLTKKNILQSAHILDTGSLDTIDWALGRKDLSKEEFIKEFGRLKPCIHGSDAHCLEKICAPDGDKFCWVKADPIFEGLKQIVYEPEERVRIQSTSPFDDKEKVFFDNLSLTGSKNFVIPNMQIPLNREFVTIIGGRGSGKSALLESVALLNEDHTKEDQNGKKRIIEYYRQNIDNKDPAPGFTISVVLTDKDGNQEQHSKSLENKQNMGLPFLFIGQEQLSALATNDSELTKTICDLINLDFSELRKTEIVDRGRDLLADIRNTSAELADLYQKYSDYKDEDFGKWIEGYISKRDEQRKRLSSKATKDLLEEIAKATDKGLKLKDFRQSLENLKQDLKGISVNEQIEELNERQKELFGEKATPIPLIDLTTQRDAVKARLHEVDSEMQKLRDLIIGKRKQLVDLGLKEDINALLQSAEMVQREIANATKDREIYKQKKVLLERLTQERNQLFTEIEKYLNENRKQIDGKFAEFQKSRDDSKKDEKDLFDQIIKDISVEGAITFDQERFCSTVLENCVDKRTIRNDEELRSFIAGKTEKGVARDIAFDSLKSWVVNRLDGFLDSGFLTTRGYEYLTTLLFTRWSEFLSVKAVAKLKGVPTEKLSVGQRGTLLLKVYLATATAKQIFIVDQPEDNLDNQFIMNELVPLIRQIKKSRQIIVSTHNANLVVNADCEQVIVARLDNEGDYVSGAIENPIINKDIKEILEGGESAFRDRANKYGIARF